jgi:hypothetical protein
MFPCPFPNETQVSINHRKASEVCSPFVPHVTILCLRCSFPCLHVFILRIDHMLLLLIYFLTHLQVYPRRAHARWVSQETLHPPTLQFFPSLTTSVDLHDAPTPSLDLVTTQQPLSSIVVKGSSPQEYPQSMPKC